MTYEQTTEEQSAFDVCLSVYRACSEQIGTGRLGAIDASAFKSNQWKPDRKPRAEDYLADFAQAGVAALKRDGQHSRLVLFRMHYLAGAPYWSVRQLLKLSEMGWVRWTEEIRKTVGQELVRRELYPPDRYFEEFRSEARGEECSKT
ncbi:MAG TPA: hypothetical protein VKQ28_00705 [Candidatus Acidoferrum sp.]|nr:hypothetical protein [Candidatus Acidoferrum sp.]